MSGAIANEKLQRIKPTTKKKRLPSSEFQQELDSNYFMEVFQKNSQLQTRVHLNTLKKLKKRTNQAFEN
jgi:hypothetical protein